MDNLGQTLGHGFRGRGTRETLTPIPLNGAGMAD